MYVHRTHVVVILYKTVVLVICFWSADPGVHARIAVFSFFIRVLRGRARKRAVRGRASAPPVYM